MKLAYFIYFTIILFFMLVMFQKTFNLLHNVRVEIEDNCTYDIFNKDVN